MSKLLFLLCLTVYSSAYPLHSVTLISATKTSFTNISEINQGDFYIDRHTGKILGRDGSYTKKLRVIDKREWDYVQEEKGGSKSLEGTKELHNNSYVLSFDENQIQRQIQSLGEDTAKDRIEHQLYIILNVNNGKVFAFRETNLDKSLNHSAVIEMYTIGAYSAPRVADGYMLLAEVHGHPKPQGWRLFNLPTASDLDVQVAKSLNIDIFVVDAYDDRRTKNVRRIIHMVDRKGQLKNYVGQTKDSERSATFNFTDYFTKALTDGHYTHFTHKNQ